MVNSEKKHYYLVYLDSLNLEELTVRNLYDTVVSGLSKKVKYASLITSDGTFRADTEGFELEDLTDDDFIEVFTDGGELDVESTAKLVVMDFLANGALIVMRQEKDMYEFVDDRCKKWIDKIIQGNNNDKRCPKRSCDCDEESCGKKL